MNKKIFTIGLQQNVQHFKKLLFDVRKSDKAFHYRCLTDFVFGQKMLALGDLHHKEIRFEHLEKRVPR